MGSLYNDRDRKLLGKVAREANEEKHDDEALKLYSPLPTSSSSKDLKEPLTPRKRHQHGEATVSYCLKISPELLQLAKAQALQEGVGLNMIIAALLERWLKIEKQDI